MSHIERIEYQPGCSVEIYADHFEWRQPGNKAKRYQCSSIAEAKQKAEQLYEGYVMQQWKRGEAGRALVDGQRQQVWVSPLS